MKKAGRPRKGVCDKLSEPVCIRLTKYERASWGMAADSLGMSLSEWIRDCVLVANLEPIGKETDE